MRLSDYLTREGMTPSRFAELVDVYPSTVTRWLRRERRPDIEQIAKIQTATNGAVTAVDFVGPQPSEAAE